MHGIIWACFILTGVWCMPQGSEVIDGATSGSDCRTGRELRGLCVARERCDEGPGNIDHILYAPRGYKRPCSSKEMCCPLQYVTLQETTGVKENN